MTADLEALVVAAYVVADEYPAPARPGRPAKVTDAELVCLAVCQAAMGTSSDRQFLGGACDSSCSPTRAECRSAIRSCPQARRSTPAWPSGSRSTCSHYTLGILLNTLAGRPARALAAYDGR